VSSVAVYTKFANAVWNALRTYTDLVDFRVARGGGTDFDGSSDLQAFPTTLPNTPDSPAIAIVLGSPPDVEASSSKQWDESITLKVYLWINTRQPDDFNRFVELANLAIEDKAEFCFRDSNSPSLSFPDLIVAPVVRPGDVLDPTELPNNWWRATFLVDMTFTRNFTI
jgi:hypothetical protein